MSHSTTPPEFRLHSQTPDAFEQSHLKTAIIASLVFHAALIAFMIFKSILLPSESKTYLPSMRVDLVALPGHKVTETPILTPVAQDKKPEKPKSEPIKAPETKVKLEKTEKPDITFAAKTAKKKKSNEKIKNALAKIKALEKIAAMQKAADESEPIKGNTVSKGSSTSGEAKTSLETTYFDVVLEKVRANWELPQWLQDKNFNAKVLILIDRNGQILSYQLITSSGNEQFDQEVKRAIQTSAPFPPPPAAILPDLGSQGIKLGFPL